MPLDFNVIVSNGSSFIDTLPAANGASVSIVTNEAGDLVAPYKLQMEASSLSGFDFTPNTGSGYDPAWSQPEYVTEITSVDLGDYPSATPMPDSARNRNIQIGPQPAFALDQPGTYTITMWVRDRSGNIGVASITRTIVAPETAYPTTQTGVVSFASNFTGKPTGATEISTLTALNSFIAGATTANQRRVLFRRGESFTLTGTIETTVGAGGNVRIGSSDGFGSGADPIITSPPTLGQIFNAGNSGNKVIYNLDPRPYNGGCDPTDGSGVDVDTPIGVVLSGGAHTLLHNIPLANFRSNVYDGGAGDFKLMLSQVNISDWGGTATGSYGGYPLYWYTSSSAARRSVVGCSIMQNENALVAAGYGPYRDPSGMNVHVTASCFSSRSGDGAVVQPAVRWNTDNTADGRGYFDRCVYRGGLDMFVQNEDATSRASQECNLVVEGGLYIYTPETGYAMKFENTGISVRNSIIYTDRSVSLSPFNFVEGSGTSASIYDHPVEIYGNSFVRQNSSGWGGDILGSKPGGLTSTEDNNLLYGSVADGLRSDGPIDITTAIPGFVVPGGDLFPTCTPAVGSGAENDEQAGLMSTFDINLAIRAATADRGAREI